MHRSLVVVGLCALLAGQAGAQSHPQTRDGFGISFGLGGGSAGISCEECPSERETALSGYLRLGGYVSPTLFVGGETNGWTKSELGVDGQFGALSAVLQWYPQATNGLYLKGGAGFASTTLEDADFEIQSNGFAVTAGAGFDWRLTRNFSLTPYVNYLHQLGAEADVNGVGTGFDLNSNIFQFGLGFTWH